MQRNVRAPRNESCCSSARGDSVGSARDERHHQLPCTCRCRDESQDASSSLLSASKPQPRLISYKRETSKSDDLSPLPFFTIFPSSSLCLCLSSTDYPILSEDEKEEEFSASHGWLKNFSETWLSLAPIFIHSNKHLSI